MNCNSAAPLLIVEDSDEDFDVLKMTLERKSVFNPLIRCEAGEEVIPALGRMLAVKEQLPALILLDLNLLGMNGRQVLTQLKMTPEFRAIPVLILSTSANAREVQACLEAGANSYSMKPVDLEKFEEFVGALKEFWLDHCLLPGWSNLVGRDQNRQL